MAAPQTVPSSNRVSSVVTVSGTAWLKALAAALAGVAVFAAAAASLDPGLRPRRRPAPFTPGDEEAIRGTLRAYHRIYQDFFASAGGPALLDDFPASADVKHHVFRDVGFLGASGLVQVQDLATETVVAVRGTDAGLAEADAYEEWNYVLQNLTDRTPVSRVKGMGQGFRYVLRRSDRGWRVVRWEIADVAPPAPEGGQP